MGSSLGLYGCTWCLAAHFTLVPHLGRIRASYARWVEYAGRFFVNILRCSWRVDSHTLCFCLISCMFPGLFGRLCGLSSWIDGLTCWITWIFKSFRNNIKPLNWTQYYDIWSDKFLDISSDHHPTTCTPCPRESRRKSWLYRILPKRTFSFISSNVLCQVWLGRGRVRANVVTCSHLQVKVVKKSS